MPTREQQPFSYLVKDKDIVEIEIKELVKDPEKFANLTGTAFAGVDEWVWTPVRNLQAFDKSAFDKIFLHHYANDAITLVIALLFGGIYYSAYLYRLKKKANSFNYNHVTQKLKQADPNTITTDYGPETFNEMLQEDLKSIENIWQEFYPDKYKIFFTEDKSGGITAGKAQLKVILRAPAQHTVEEQRNDIMNEQEQPQASEIQQEEIQQVNTTEHVQALETQPLLRPVAIANNHDWLTKLKSIRAVKAVAFVWDFLNKNAMAYWMLWVSFAIFTGMASITALSGIVLPALLLSLPLLIPLFYAGLRLKQWINNKRNKEEVIKNADEHLKQAEIEQANRQVMKIYFLRKHAANVNTYLDKQVIDNKITLQNLTSQVDLASLLEVNIAPKCLKSKQELIAVGKPLPDTDYIKKIRSNKKKIFFSVVTGFFAGYLTAAFAQWPVTDFLTLVGVAMVASPAIITIAAITFTIATTYAIYKGVKAYQEVQENVQELEGKNKADNKIDYIKGLEHEINCSRNNIRKLNLKVENLVHHNNYFLKKLKVPDAKPLKCEEWQKYKQYPDVNNDRFFDTLELQSQKSTWVKKFANRAASWVAGAGSGAFFVRSLFLTGGLIALFVAVPPPVTIAIVVGVAAVYGMVKAYHYHLNKQKLHERNFIHEIAVREECLEQNYKYLAKVENSLQESHDQLSDLRNSLSGKVVEARNRRMSKQYGVVREKVYSPILTTKLPVYRP